jgi:cyclase
MTRTFDFKIRPPFFLLLIAFLFAAGPSFGDTGARLITELADGVYAIQHKDLPGGTSGNTTVIIGQREVFVVDSSFLPSVAREDIAQIRRWTDKPVGYLLNTHFHNDHNNGNKAYLEAFPNLTIIAQEETKKDMDLIQPGNIERMPLEIEALVSAYHQGKGPDGKPLSEDDRKQLAEALPGLEQIVAEFKTMSYQGPTLTFKDRLTIDIGNREVQVKYLGRGNTAGDAIAYLPKEKILVAGDLLDSPIPNTYDGYPSEWVQTLHRMGELDANTIVLGHGAVLHDKAYLYLVADLLQSAVDQMRQRIREIGFPGSHSLDDVKGSVNLTPFRPKFAGNDKDLQAQFDDMAANLVRITFTETAQR